MAEKALNDVAAHDGLDNEQYKSEARLTSPRTNNLLPVFAEIALGNASRPDIADAIPDPALLSEDLDTLAFAVYLANYTGIFHRHLHASVPFFAEEECRLGLAISQYATDLAKRKGYPTKFWSFGSAEAPMARAAVRHAEGALQAHCSSENTENFGDLRARPESNVSIEVGPFYDLTHETFGEMTGTSAPALSYDIIFEHTCFQMHHKERAAPLRILRERLENDGIFLIYEKLRDHDVDAYQAREQEKDREFKARFFSAQEVETKKSSILTYMEECQVYAEDLVAAIRPVAKYIVRVWQSGNFFGFVASNSEENLRDFIGYLSQPFVENKTYLAELPQSLGAPLTKPVEFRKGRMSIG
ncbi:hypothetical protein ACFWM0_32850 [Streptomyces sp. NPDC058405]|uniref:hypothetical protein n=1 Tax=unclassified Streptomyces TaxID=2593676 RepID=UPI0036661651